MTDDFDALVLKGYDELPAWVREKIKNVGLLIEHEPSKKERLEQGLSEDETLLGLYKGIPLSERGEFYGVGMTLPDTITLFKKPILEAAQQEGRSVQEIVTETIWHEFAHHFGMDEHEVRLREHTRDEQKSS